MLETKGNFNSIGLCAIDDEALNVVSGGDASFRKAMMAFFGTAMALGSFATAFSALGTASKTWEISNLLRNTLFAVCGSAAALGGAGSGIILGSNVSKVLEDVKKQSLSEKVSKETEIL